jgi:hypothetical protein
MEKTTKQQLKLKRATESVLSTARAFVDQQQYIFDMLWHKAIPAKQRIKEIEEGADTIQDNNEIISLLFDLLAAASEEILIIFSSIRIFNIYMNRGVMNRLREQLVNHAVNIRILIGQNTINTINSTNEMLDQDIPDIIGNHTNCQIQFDEKAAHTKVTIFSDAYQIPHRNIIRSAGLNYRNCYVLQSLIIVHR